MKVWKDRTARIGKSMAACLTAAAFLCGAGDRSRSRPHYERTAFTMEYVQTMTNVQRGTSFALEMFWAERGDGARSYGLAGIYPRRRTVIDPVQKVQVRISDAYRLKSTYDFRAYPVTPRRIEYGADCYPPGNEFTYIGDDTILGYRAHHYVRKPVPGAAGYQESHYWFAPGLGCHKIQHVAYMRDANGVVTNIFEEKPAIIRREEPDPALFAVPDDYREVRPSELERTLLYGMVRQREGYEGVRRHVIPESTLKYWAVLDEQYENVKQRKIP